MRTGNEITLKAAIDKLLDTYKLRGKLAEVQLKESWNKIMGDVIARETKAVSLKNGKLFVEVESAPLRQDLNYMRTKIKDRLNGEIGQPLIKEVVFR